MALVDLLTELGDERAPGARALLRWGRVPFHHASMTVCGSSYGVPTFFRKRHWAYDWNSDDVWWRYVAPTANRRCEPDAGPIKYVQRPHVLPRCWVRVVYAPGYGWDVTDGWRSRLAPYAPGRIGSAWIVYHGYRHVLRAQAENMAMVAFTMMDPKDQHKLLTKEVP